MAPGFSLSQDTCFQPGMHAPARGRANAAIFMLQCSTMRRTSVRELHIHTSELVREAADGGIIVIERRGEPVAELRPFTAPSSMPARKKAQIFHSMEKIWARLPKAGDSTKILEEDRDR